MADDVLISAGEVIEVQLTSETVVMQTPQGRRAVEQGHITSRMRLFVTETDGAEKTYDFENAKLGVRETQRVAIVRARRKGAEPYNLLLFNLSSGEHDAFEPGLRALLGRKPVFAPAVKAVIAGLMAAIIFWLVAHYVYGRGPVMAGFLGGFFGFLTVPAFWLAIGFWDRAAEELRYRSARKRFIAEMGARARAFVAAPSP